MPLLMLYDEGDAKEAIREGFYRSCGSPYLYYIVIIKKNGKVAVSQESMAKYPSIAVPPWSLSKRYSNAKGFFSLFNSPQLFVYDRMLKKHVARRDAILEEMGARMKTSVKSVTKRVDELINQ